MSKTWEELRDLIHRIEILVSCHPAHSLVREETSVFVEHLRLKARVHELNSRASLD